MVNVFHRLFKHSHPSRKRRASSSQDLINRNAVKISEAWAVVHGNDNGKEFGKVYACDLHGIIWMHEGAECNFVKATDLSAMAQTIQSRGYINPVWWVHKKPSGVDLPDWASEAWS